ncbi:MAG: CvpA family protein [Bythopirellula sp.]
MTYLLVLVGFLFFAGVAMCLNEGLWNNTVLLLLVLISGLAGVTAGVPLGSMLLEQSGKGENFAWYFVFAGVWGTFSVTLLVLRIVADKASNVRIRFLPVVDKIGGILMGLFVAVMLSSFAAYTLLKIPVEAGEWKKKDASAAVRGYFGNAATPFHTVVRKFVKAEDIDSRFYR